MTSPLASRGLVRLDLERGRLARALGARRGAPERQESRIAMRTSTGARDARLERIDRQARLAQAERAVLGVARVIEEERGVLAVLRRLGRLHLDGGQRARAAAPRWRRSAASRPPRARRRGG